MKIVKVKHAVFIIALVIIADQALKIWIKTSYHAPGEVTKVLGLNWFQLYFIENSGMAWGWNFGNDAGKMILTLFRLGAVIFGTWYIGKIIRKGYKKGFIICVALIYAGALGNLLDSMFYGMIFDKGLHYDPAVQQYVGYSGVASFSTDGYSSFLHGSVVDMLYFPIIDSKFPSWFPFVGGEDFQFFSPIFNLADASISAGVITLFIFQKRFFRKPESTHEATAETSPGTETGESKVEVSS